MLLWGLPLVAGPRAEHMRACSKVFGYHRYILDTGEYKVTYRAEGEGLVGACDASWADVYESSKST